VLSFIAMIDYPFGGGNSLFYWEFMSWVGMQEFIGGSTRIHDLQGPKYSLVLSLCKR
jgi:hypothetical protein